MKLSIIVKNISFQLPSGDYLFNNISTVLGMKKTGLIGKNGCGKTTFLRLLVHEIEPLKGSIDISHVKIGYLPQDYQFNLQQTVLEALGISEKMKALQKIQNGETDQNLFDVIGSDWDIFERTQECLKQFQMDHVDITRTIETFSGGERMRIALAKLLIFESNFLILDEPTNNLDQLSKEIIHNLIKNWKGGLIVVSHDRELLNLMDSIMEISEKEIKNYGGNFEMYKNQKTVEENAAHQQFINARQELKKITKQAQLVRERQQKRSNQGKKTRGKRGIPKIILGMMKKNAQKTSTKLKAVHEKRIEQAGFNKKVANERIPKKNKIIIDLSQTKVPNGKIISKLENLTFAYKNQKPLLKNFNFVMTGPERIAIKGRNGSGKTTLVKIIIGALTPEEGNVYKGFKTYAYLEQSTNLGNMNMSLIKNIEQFAQLTESDARNWLAKFLFSDQDVFKKIEDLSGGERVKAKLSCILAGDNPPQLLILDEPTNNLDLDSVEQLESALSNYEGALIVISHDQTFLKNIGIEREIIL